VPLAAAGVCRPTTRVAAGDGKRKRGREGARHGLRTVEMPPLYASSLACGHSRSAARVLHTPTAATMVKQYNMYNVQAAEFWKKRCDKETMAHAPYFDAASSVADDDDRSDLYSQISRGPSQLSVASTNTRNKVRDDVARAPMHTAIASRCPTPPPSPPPPPPSPPSIALCAAFCC
jgi:hypothetical protein